MGCLYLVSAIVLAVYNTKYYTEHEFDIVDLIGIEHYCNQTATLCSIFAILSIISTPVFLIWLSYVFFFIIQIKKDSADIKKIDNDSSRQTMLADCIHSYFRSYFYDRLFCNFLLRQVLYLLIGEDEILS